MARIALTLLVVISLATGGVSCGSDDGGTTELPKEGLVVKWNIDTKTHQTDNGICDLYKIANWSVTVVGPGATVDAAPVTKGPIDVPCAGEWSSGTSFSADEASKVHVGLQDITVVAKDAAGAEIAKRTSVGFTVAVGGTSPDEANVGFLATDMPAP